MDKSKRKAIIAGNWKMNKTPSEAKALLTELAPMVKDADCEVIACVPFVDLTVALEATEGTNIQIGAENCHWEESGAFTGEISAKMLAEMGVPYVVLGHSERRQYFGETDETVNKRTKAALAHGLKPIVCVGELLWERECDITEEVCAFIRATLAKLYGQEVADAVTIQYGGSMNAGNCEELLSKTDVDGGLIGGASLVAEKFQPIVAAASK